MYNTLYGCVRLIQNTIHVYMDVLMLYVGCSEDNFRCDGGRCLDRDRVCDRRTNCDDGTDEDQDCRMYIPIYQLSQTYCVAYYTYLYLPL